MVAGESDEDETDPMKVLLPDEPEVEKRLTSADEDAQKQRLQDNHIHSIDTTVVIRQLPSQGLSFQLWPAATTLVTLLDQLRSHPTNSPLSPILSALSNGQDHRPLRILELGSGTGLVGIVAAATLSANVTVTDLPHVIPNLQFNVQMNSHIWGPHGGTVEVAPLRWGEADDVELIGREFDLILASDVVYHDHLYDPLLQTLRMLMGLEGADNKKMMFVMAHLRRWKKESAFFRKAKKLFQVETLHVDRPTQGSRVGVVTYSFRGKSQNFEWYLAILLMNAELPMPFSSSMGNLLKKFSCFIMDF